MKTFRIAGILSLGLVLWAAVLTACQSPAWQGNIQSFHDDGLSVVALDRCVVECHGVTKTLVPSLVESTATLTLTNPRSIEVSCGVSAQDGSLFQSGPVVSAVRLDKAVFVFTPALLAEHKDLILTVTLSAPSLNRTFDPQEVVVHCDTVPGSVASSLDAALDLSGCAFAAFRLPSSATDDDLARVEITAARADGSGSPQVTTLPSSDASLLATRLSVDGRDLLGSSGALNRYFQPAVVSSGDDYIFTVVVLDTAGQRSEAAQITSNATPYPVTYDGNGGTEGRVPADSTLYRQTNSVTALSQRTLARAGYDFSGWNTASDGSGTACAVGGTIPMPAGGVTFYAQWVRRGAATVTVTFTVDTAYGVITFGSPTVTVARPNRLELVTGAGATGWHWYVNDVLDSSQTSSTFSVDTSTWLPGQYIINVDATESGRPCTGSIRVTVTY